MYVMFFLNVFVCVCVGLWDLGWVLCLYSSIAIKYIFVIYAVVVVFAMRLFRLFCYYINIIISIE